MRDRRRAEEGGREEPTAQPRHHPHHFDVLFTGRANVEKIAQRADRELRASKLDVVQDPERPMARDRPESADVLIMTERQKP
jgi:hypothetical protein